MSWIGTGRREQCAGGDPQQCRHMTAFEPYAPRMATKYEYLCEERPGHDTQITDAWPLACSAVTVAFDAGWAGGHAHFAGRPGSGRFCWLSPPGSLAVSVWLAPGPPRIVNTCSAPVRASTWAIGSCRAQQDQATAPVL